VIGGLVMDDHQQTPIDSLASVPNYNQISRLN